MNQLEGFIKLFDIIKNDIKHPNYKRVCELAETYEAFSTGKDLDERLEKFASRESEDAFRERKKITIEICSSIVANLTHIFYRVPRSNGVKTKWTISAQDKQLAFLELLDNFGFNGFTHYMEQKLKDNIELDPNKWVVVEFLPTDGSILAQPYPYEVDSEQAIMFEYRNSELLYLVDKKEIKRFNNDGIEKECYRYTIYTKEGSIVIESLPDDHVYTQMQDWKGELTQYIDVFNLKNISYQLIVPNPYNLSVVPAKRVGYVMDKQTNGETFVNFYDIIVPFLTKMLKTNSEMDITMAKHAHMQKIQYVRKCTNTGCSCNDKGIYVIYNEDKEVKCNICQGKGYMDVTTGGLEYIYLPMPSTKDEMLDLNNIVNYIALPIDQVKMQNEYIQWLIEMCKKVMYNSDIFSKQQISETATEKNIEMENVYDTLYPYAINYAKFYTFILTTIADITDTEELSIQVSINKDFKLLSKTELITLLQQASTAGANELVLDAINDEIAYSFYGESTSFDKYKLMQRLLPFQNKSREQQMLILAQLDKTDPFYVSFMFGQDVLNKLEYDNADFYLLTFERQKALYDAEINTIASSLKVAAPELPTFA